MSANAAAKKQKPLKRHPSKLKRMSAYMILTLILISIVAVLFAFPLYWIITGSFKTGAAINATTPEWWPSQWVLTNYQKLFSGKSAPLWQLAVPFGSKFSADGEPSIPGILLFGQTSEGFTQVVKERNDSCRIFLCPDYHHMGCARVEQQIGRAHV